MKASKIHANRICTKRQKKKLHIPYTVPWCTHWKQHTVHPVLFLPCWITGKGVLDRSVCNSASSYQNLHGKKQSKETLNYKRTIMWKRVMQFYIKWAHKIPCTWSIKAFALLKPQKPIGLIKVQFIYRVQVGEEKTIPGALFLAGPETLQAIFGCHNSLCISTMERN